MRTTTLFLAAAFAAAVLSSGCATVHRYPAYRGRVLELGTDKPIEGAGVLALYRMTISMPPERNSRHLGYQAVLTDGMGRFEIPPKFFSEFQLLGSFDSHVRITIYKRGYGNFPGSFPFHGDTPGVSRATPTKEGKSRPKLIRDQLPPEEEVMFWLPRLETEEEITENDRTFSPPMSGVLDEKWFPPPGTRKGQFLPSEYTGERR